MLTAALAAKLTDTYAPGSLTTILAHNTFPDHGKYADRLDRVIAAGVPPA
jgi:hypothetical protein